MQPTDSRSPISTCPEDDLSSQELDNASADEYTTDVSDNNSEEQFAAKKKNQPWSQGDARTLCQWVEVGRPWYWIVRQFAMGVWTQLIQETKYTVFSTSFKLVPKLIHIGSDKTTLLGGSKYICKHSTIASSTARKTLETMPSTSYAAMDMTLFDKLISPWSTTKN